MNFDASSAVRFRSSLSSPHDVIKASPFNRNVHHRGFWPKQLPAVWNLRQQGGSEGPTFIFRTAWRYSSLLNTTSPLHRRAQTNMHFIPYLRKQDISTLR